MKKLITSRRGVAIELAIGVLLVMSALGIILVTNASLQNKEMKSDVSRFEQKIELYEITDEIIKNPDLNEFNGYIIAKSEREYTKIQGSEPISVKEITYTVTQGGNTVLTFTVEDGKITSWN